MKGLGTTLGGNKCCKNICFSFLHLLHFIPPLHFGSFPILSSWFFSPPPVLFLPEEQHYPLLSLCTSFFFFFFFILSPPFCILLRSSPLSTRRWAPQPGGGELQQGSPPTCKLPSVCLPPTTAPLHLLLQERSWRGGRRGRDTRQLRASAASGRHRLGAAARCSARSSCGVERGVRTDGS